MYTKAYDRENECTVYTSECGKLKLIDEDGGHGALIFETPNGTFVQQEWSNYPEGNLLKYPAAFRKLEDFCQFSGGTPMERSLQLLNPSILGKLFPQWNG